MPIGRTNRRTFITALGGAVGWTLVTHAEQARKIPVIGVLWHAANEQEEANYLAALRKGLSDLGYVEGQNIILKNRFAAENYRFSAIAKELVDLNVDVLVAVTPPAALAAQRVTSTIPIVFVIDPDPVARKLVASFAHPGGNITGLTALASGDQGAKRLEILNDAIPNLSRVAFRVNMSSPTAASTIEVTKAAASSLGIIVEPIEVRRPDDLDQGFAAITKQGFGAVSIHNDSMLYNERQRIAELALRAKLPYDRAATYIDKILKGESPAEIPVEQPTKLELVIT